MSLNVYRRDAKALVRAFRVGDPIAVARAERAMGSRVRARFVLADAQHVVALESGFRSWRDLRQRFLTELDHSAAVAAATARSRFRVRARRRGYLVRLDDAGAAVAASGKPPGWLEVAREVVEMHSLNINRAGVIFVGVRYDRDVVELASRLADTAAHVYEALLELRHDS
ncbi:MAG: hypothetical protein MSC30_07070 [Gaiellaceae bacterium MAG52_C11]|nr:hypothetical protein [Candidatus Gaiellasilicea maunaloa]